jgi:hypothetical protein
MSTAFAPMLTRGEGLTHGDSPRLSGVWSTPSRRPLRAPAATAGRRYGSSVFSVLG